MFLYATCHTLQMQSKRYTSNFLLIAVQFGNLLKLTFGYAAARRFFEVCLVFGYFLFFFLQPKIFCFHMIAEMVAEVIL